MFDDSCHYFDVIVDELFDEARLITDEVAQDVDLMDDKFMAVTKQRLLRLLHVFILPKLSLRANDLKAVETVLTTINKQDKDFKVKLANKEKSRKSAEKYLNEQRKSLLTHQDFSSESHVSSCNYEFLKEFLKHLQDDVVAANQTLVEFDNEISPLRNSEIEKDIKRLEYLRNKRETILVYLNKCVMAREAIKNIIKRPHIKKADKYVSKESSVHPNHLLYMEAACRFQRVTDEIKELTNTVAKLTSVKEATLQAIHEIEEYGESYVHRPTASESVLNRKAESGEWSSLSKKVDNLVSAKPLGFRNKHKMFCKTMISKCQKLFNGSKSLASCGLESKAKKCDIDTNMSLTKGIFHDNGNKPNAAIEAISKEVIKHISDMSESLAEELYKRPAKEIRQCILENIYICYESHVSEELMPVLHQLYENCYKQQCESLLKWISQKALSETLIANVDSGNSEQDSVVAVNDESEDTISVKEDPGFEKFEVFVKTETETVSVFAKLRTIMKIVQYVGTIANEEGDKVKLVCADDILDVIIPYLQKLDSETFLKLYAHINLLGHLSPDFVEGNCHEYALISFHAAYQHLFDQHVLDKASKKTGGTYSKVS